jgi:hypothetical protein
MDLARELRRLDVEWPDTPELRPELAPRRARRRWPLAVALAVLVAVAAALAVPQSRGAILRFLHLGAATIERVDTLPPAERRPLEVGLGPVVPIAEARQVIPRLLLPPGPRPALHRSGAAISMVFAHNGEPVLLSEFGDIGYFKKLAAGGTHMDQLQVGSDYGLWIEGLEHDFFFPGASPRLAGNTLIWVHASTTYRLEGKRLTRADALDLARALRPHTP